LIEEGTGPWEKTILLAVGENWNSGGETGRRTMREGKRKELDQAPVHKKPL